MIDPRVHVQVSEERDRLLRQNHALLTQQAFEEAIREEMKHVEFSLRARIATLESQLAHSEAQMERMAQADSRRPFFDPPTPTVRGIEYAARRLWRIGTRTCPQREPASSWSEVDAGRRAGWRAIAIAVWCHPQTSKTLR